MANHSGDVKLAPTKYVATYLQGLPAVRTLTSSLIQIDLDFSDKIC